jgi:hypothetical protein
MYWDALEAGFGASNRRGIDYQNPQVPKIHASQNLSFPKVRFSVVVGVSGVP